MENLYDKVLSVTRSKNSKYFYSDKTLKEYCEENDINLSKIYSRIKILKKEFPDITNEEIIEFVMDDSLFIKQTGNNAAYYYKGISLRKYCLQNNISYTKIYQRIQAIRETKLFDDLKEPEIIEIAMDDDLFNEVRNPNGKYYFNNLLLSIYCKKKNIDYVKVMNRIRTLKTKVKNMSYNDIIKIAMNDKQYHSIVREKNNGKYSRYKGITLKKYCKENNINYVSLLNEICLLDQKNNFLTEDEIIYLALGIYYKNKQYKEEIKTKYQKKLLISLKNILQNYKEKNLDNNKQIKELIKKIN